MHAMAPTRAFAVRRPGASEDCPGCHMPQPGSRPPPPAAGCCCPHWRSPRTGGQKGQMPSGELTGGGRTLPSAAADRWAMMLKPVHPVHCFERTVCLKGRALGSRSCLKMELPPAPTCHIHQSGTSLIADSILSSQTYATCCTANCTIDTMAIMAMWGISRGTWQCGG